MESDQINLKRKIYVWSFWAWFYHTKETSAINQNHWHSEFSWFNILHSVWKNIPNSWDFPLVFIISCSFSFTFYIIKFGGKWSGITVRWTKAAEECETAKLQHLHTCTFFCQPFVDYMSICPAWFFCWRQLRSRARSRLNLTCLMVIRPHTNATGAVGAN